MYALYDLYKNGRLNIKHKNCIYYITVKKQRYNHLNERMFDSKRFVRISSDWLNKYYFLYRVRF